ncbi:MAG: hypothetical protein ACTHQM_09500, partial [Thermoanaerobaculia bacterium]
MDQRFRSLFNEQFTPELYAWYQRELSSRLNTTFEFRLAESPVFLTDDFKQRAVNAATAIIEQLSDPATIARMKAAIPERWDTPGMDGLPSFSQVDFAVVNENGTLVPKLIELQGFPSLTALQVIQRDVWKDTLAQMDGLDVAWSCWFSGYDRESCVAPAPPPHRGHHPPPPQIRVDLHPTKPHTPAA